jgi:hypothetical protein
LNEREMIFEMNESLFGLKGKDIEKRGGVKYDQK